MFEEDFEVTLKVVVVGNGGVGKSSMIQRYCKNVFYRDYKKTIGVDFLEKQLDFQGSQLKLMLWDTAGQEEFDAITKAYYRGAHACVIAFSITDRASFEAVANWKKKVEAEVGEIAMTIVKNKIDLVDDAVVSEAESSALAERLNLRLFATSVKENWFVADVFYYLVNCYFESTATTLNLSASLNSSFTPRSGTSLFTTQVVSNGKSGRSVDCTDSNSNGATARSGAPRVEWGTLALHAEPDIVQLDAQEAIRLTATVRRRTHGKKHLFDKTRCRLL